MGDASRLGRLPNAPYLVEVITVLGLLIVVVAALTHRTTPQPGGLFQTIGPIWYIGLALIVAAAAWASARRRSVALPMMVLSGVIVLSQALMYGTPTVMSAARHVGIVDYIRVHHGAQPKLDIYQAWSGAFAGVAWVCDVAGISDPMVVATWWPVVLSPALALAVTVLAGRWVRGGLRPWIAGVLFALTSTLNIIYFSPQSLGLLLALVVFAVSVRPPERMLPAPRKDDEQGGAGGPSGLADGSPSELSGPLPTLPARILAATYPLGPARLAFVLYLSCVMAVTHQISPYLTVAGLAALTVFGFVRPWWVSLVVIAPAVGWALANRGVLGGFVSLGAVGRLWDNIQPPVHSFTQFSPALVTRLAFDVPAAVLVVLGLATLAAAWAYRGRAGWALLAAGASPGSLFLATDYGQEGIFRVVLFAGPWLAVLAAGLPWTRPRWTFPVVSGALAVLLAVSVYGQTALDWNRVVRHDAADATRLYETYSSDDSINLLMGTSNASPLSRTARYLDVVYVSRESFGGYPKDGEPYDAAADVASMTYQLQRDRPSSQYYALVSDSIGAYDDRYGFQRYDQYLELAAAMAASPSWRPIYQGPTTTLYVLR